MLGYRRVLAMVVPLLLLASACGSGSGELEAVSNIADVPEASEDGDGLSSETIASEAIESESTESEGQEEPGEADDSAAPEALSEDPEAEGCIADEFLCVGLVTDLGAVDDVTTHNGSAWEAVQNSGADESELFETTDQADHGTNIQTLIDRDYDVIVTVGTGIGPATVQAATANPDVTFIGVDQDGGSELENLATVVFADDQLGFLAGALAGLMTETGTVAAVFGTDLDPDVRAMQAGFELGVRHTNQDAELFTRFHPGAEDVAFADPSWGAETARQALISGADVVFGTGGSTGTGALAEVAQDGDALCIGADRDQWDEVPQARVCLMTSATKLVAPTVAELIDGAAQGTFVGGDTIGQVGLADYRNFDSDVPTDVKVQLAELTEQVRSGEVETGG